MAIHEDLYKLPADMLLVLLSTSCNPNGEQEKWIWDTEVLTPRLVSKNGTIPDTLRPKTRFAAKLFEIAIDTSKRPGVEYPYKGMNKFIKLIGDTAFIDIPTDTLLKYEAGTLKWRTGYRLIFTDH